MCLFTYLIANFQALADDNIICRMLMLGDEHQICGFCIVWFFPAKYPFSLYSGEMFTEMCVCLFVVVVAVVTLSIFLALAYCVFSTHILSIYGYLAIIYCFFFLHFIYSPSLFSLAVIALNIFASHFLFNHAQNMNACEHSMQSLNWAKNLK